MVVCGVCTWHTPLSATLIILLSYLKHLLAAYNFSLLDFNLLAVAA